jgi:riboflavin biosynthesis pyrimidine reductase
VSCGPTRVDLTGLLAVLDDIGTGVVLCEGGPDLNHQLLAAGLVDEVCLVRSRTLPEGAAYETLARFRLG